MSLTKRDVLLILLVHVIGGLCFLSPSYIRPDSVAVMSWLRSAAIDHDFLFFDEWAGFGMIGNGFAWFKEVTPVGALANHWWVGTSILCAPFWGVAHLVSLALPGPMFPDDGFFGLDLTMLGWVSVLSGALASIAAAAMLREVDPDTPRRDVAAALALTMLGTPMFWYVYRTPIGTHAAGMMLVGVLAFLCWRTVSKADDESPLLLGLVFGLATVTRLQHALLLPAVLYSAIRSRRSPRFYALFALGASLPGAVQAVAWHAVYGTPLGPLASGANLEGVTWMPFRSVQVIPVLLSSWHGLFAWSPVVLIALGGWLALSGKGGVYRELAIVFWLMFAGELLANAALDRYWWGGMSFGARRFVDLAAPFAVGIGVALRARARIAAFMLSLAGVAWSVALMLAATSGALSLSHFVTFGELLSAVHAAPKMLATAQLRSPLTDGALLAQSIVAIALVALISWGCFAACRHRGIAPSLALLVLCGICLVAAVLLVAPTRDRSARELARFGLGTGEARGAGALLDQRGLLEDEAAWLRDRGDHAGLEATRHEIEAISETLRRSGVE